MTETKDDRQNMLTTGEPGGNFCRGHRKGSVPAQRVSDLLAGKSKCYFYVPEVLICSRCDSIKDYQNELIYSFLFSLMSHFNY